MEIKEKKVELIELFYDLIYVYAISRLTLLIEEPENGILPVSTVFRYLIVCFVILQAWLYLTNYVNRYGRWIWYEYLITSINMIATVFMTNTISSDWNKMSTAFNLSMLIMLICVAIMYGLQIWLKEQDVGAARNSLTILSVDCVLYFAAFIVSVTGAEGLVIILDVIAVLVGAFLPFFVRGNFDISVINFPHLAERFELITIITFGEGVVAITEYFDVNNFSLRPILVFVVLLVLFGCYVLQIHVLGNHDRVDRALRLMFSHYFIVIAINVITVGFKFLSSEEANSFFTSGMLAVGMVVFFISIYADSVYHDDNICISVSDKVIMAIAIVAGAAIMLIGNGNFYLVICGLIIAAGTNFAVLVNKSRSLG